MDATALLAEDVVVVDVDAVALAGVASALAAVGVLALLVLAAGFFAFATTHTLLILAIGPE
ncbi:MAG: hypothetical protein WBB25_20150 [Sulfitobacter sp.]